MEACAKKRKYSIETDSDELNHDYEQPVEEVEEPEETFEEFLETVMNELIFDSALKAHFEAKHMADEDDENEPEPVLEIPRIKQFNQNVTCSNCSALVSAVRFAMHLGEFGHKLFIKTSDPNNAF